MNITFSGKTALVAGGAGGLGRAVVLAFLEEGAKVIVTSRNEKEFAALQKAAGASQHLLEGHAVDVTEETAVSGLITQILKDHGRLDIMVNAVGGYAGGAKLWEEGSKTFDQMFQLNFRSGLILSRAVVPAMLKEKRGAIVNVLSKSALEPAAGLAAYSASKAASLAMMDSLAEELKASGVRVNSVVPDIIDTEANRKAMPKAAFDQWPKPEEIARVILFLCSDEAKVIHGAAVPVYGQS